MQGRTLKAATYTSECGITCLHVKAVMLYVCEATHTMLCITPSSSGAAFAACTTGARPQTCAAT